MRPKVKICGVTSPEEAVLAADLGADLVGLNFYPPSPRYLEPSQAMEIAAAVRARGAQTEPVRLVGVFVNAPAAELEATARSVGLDLLQFHGDETPAEVAPFAARAIKAFRVAPEARKRNNDPEGDQRKECDRLDAAALAGYGDVWGVLVDSRHLQLYGGTGESWNFETLRGLRSRLPRRTFIAGGLGPGNVRAAITAARPYGIDLCSGIEARPGKKDPELLEQLFEEIDKLRETRDGETSTAA